MVDPMEKSIEIYENRDKSFNLADDALLEAGSEKNTVSSKLFSQLTISLKTVFQSTSARGLPNFDGDQGAESWNA